MSLDTLAQIGEFVGGVFVVVSLIYLAHQVRQTNRFQRSENYARVLERMSTLQGRLAADADLSHIATVGAEDPYRLSRAERVRFAWALYELFGAGEFMFHQAQARALPPAVWARWDATIRWWLSHPGMRLWWAAKPAPLSPDFEAFVERVLRTGMADPSTVGRWRDFVAGAVTAGEDVSAVPR